MLLGFVFCVSATLAGSPVTVVETEEIIDSLAVSSDSLYWVTHRGAIWRASPSGHSPTQIAQSTRRISRMYASSSALFVIVQERGSPAATQRNRLEMLAGRMKTAELWMVRDGGLVLVADGLPRDPALAADSNFVYWRTSEGTILRKALSGKAQMLPTLATKAPPFSRREQIDGYWVHVVSDGNSKYWGTVSGELMVQRTGSSPRILASTNRVISSIDIDESDVYWVEGFGRVIRKVRKPTDKNQR